MDRHQAAQYRLGRGAEEAGFADHCPERVRAREAADAFHQIAVAFLVVGDGLADARDDVRGPGVVEVREAGPVTRREFHAIESTAALEHPMRFPQGGGDVGHVPDAEDDGVGVEARVGEAQALGILDLPAEASEAAPFRPVLSDLEHVGIDVGDRHMGAAARHSEGDVAGAARHVEDVLAGPRLHAIDEAVLPQPVHAARHEVVHHVVAARDRAEDLADAARLLLGADQLVAEIDFVAHEPRASSGVERPPPYRGPMPELPEVETTVRGLARVLEGRRIRSVEARRPDLRRALPEDLGQRLTGARVTGLRRRAKYGLIDTDRDDTLIFHLGMSGKWRIDPSEIGRHDHFIIETDEGRRLALNDARRFGSLDLVRTGELKDWPAFKALGPEPLDLNARDLKMRLAGRSAAIKLLLLDQRIVAGLGNIYVCEALYRAGIHPKRAGGDRKSVV